MYKFMATLMFLFCFIILKATGITEYERSIELIPMRDGVKLYTVIFTPRNSKTSFPFLIQRTPYGAYRQADFIPYPGEMGNDGYIFVYQDIRGKYRSEGTMEIHQPIIHLIKPGSTDESTDTYDTIDWLLHHVKGNNGKAGLVGISYPGWLALAGSVDPHPALAAISPQGVMADLFLGDDFHHNGAFRLSYGLEYTYMVEGDKEEAAFPFPQYDLYSWYLDLGPLKNVNRKYLHNRIPTWNHFENHPDYDEFWKINSPLNYLKYPTVPTLLVGGYFDQEDLLGPQLMYSHLEKKDTFQRNFICLGPWYHGQWAREDGKNIGNINLEIKSSEWFVKLERKWFAWWLKKEGNGNFDEANCFQTGSNQWKTYSKWPPGNSTEKKLFVRDDHTCSFSKPGTTSGNISYISDPFKPVPYRQLPIQATYGYGSRWYTWQADDQRFAYTRPDVASFTGHTLLEPLTVTGNITAHLFASTSGTDADWIVKLIDVYPAINGDNILMSGFQLPVAMEVFRGKYRKSFSKPTPLIPGKPEEFVIDLHQVNHVFKKGHKLMIQVQSSWFPVIDRNPQKFLENIFYAREQDFHKTVQTIYCNSVLPSYISLPVILE
jgi:putative CocE/NonD family hydrolase